MRDRIVVDLGRILDEVFDAAEKFGTAFKDRFEKERFGGGDFWDESMDYYPAYLYPPLNVYLKTDRSLVFEFALAGFDEKGLSLEFKGDYLVFSAKVDPSLTHEEGVRFFKRRLKLKDIEQQRYYVPEDKFDREAATAVFRSGVLILTIPPRVSAGAREGFRVDIVKEG